MSEQNRLQINWTNSAGAALGAVSSAVLLSSLGAAGTLIGAALGSLCITIGGAVYAHYLSITRERVAAQALAARRPGRQRERVAVGAGAPIPSPREEQEYAERRSHEAGRSHPETHPDVEPPVAGRQGGRERSGLAWKRILAVSALLFGIAMSLIVAFELTTGRAVSTYTGGTSNTGVGTSIPGWSGTGQESTEVELDVPAPDDVPLLQDVPLPDDEAPAQDAPADEAPADGQPPADEAPADDAPADDAPADDAPADDAPADDAPADPAPGEQPPVDEAPADPAP